MSEFWDDPTFVWVVHSFFYDASTIEGVYVTLEAARAAVDAMAGGDDDDWTQTDNGDWYKNDESNTYSVERHCVQSR